ncbi:MAG: hypothetical protein WBB19_05515 [Desulforhopalus sp.]
MATINDYFWQAQLPEAAYADLTTDMFGEDDTDYKDALINEGMSTEQAIARSGPHVPTTGRQF